LNTKIETVSTKRKPEFSDNTFAIVEATDAEQFFLWQKWHDTVKWESHNTGWITTIDTYQVAGKTLPLVVSFFYALLQGKKIVFWNVTSDFALYSAVEDFIKKEFNSAKHKSDVTNFGNIISYVNNE
jgi:hypothetical protein